MERSKRGGKETREQIRRHRERIHAQIAAAAHTLAAEGRFGETARFLQHGDVTVREHCLRVAYVSVRLAEMLPLRVRRRELIRGALLHDYFLYDWHEKDGGHRLHGFFHPGRALRNAKEDFLLTKREEDIILRHMFPLTLIPPVFAESWIVCAADKVCAAQETVRGFRRRS